MIASPTRTATAAATTIHKRPLLSGFATTFAVGRLDFFFRGGCSEAPAARFTSLPLFRSFFRSPSLVEGGGREERRLAPSVLEGGGFDEGVVAAGVDPAVPRTLSDASGLSM